MKIKYSALLLAASLAFSSCEKFLDRPQLTSSNDDTAWTSEQNLSLYANKYYTDYFVGYGLGFSTSGSLYTSYHNSDDILSERNQTSFLTAVPNSKIWDYQNVRSINIMIDRIQNRMSNVLTTEAYNHWLGIGKFFRAMEYISIVNEFGDIPYYDVPVSDADLDQLYKVRTPRAEVMQAVYDDLRFAYENVRLNDGAQKLNRYIVAGFITRFALGEGSWQKYYYNNTELAKKFMEFAVEAGSFVINSSKYNIVTPYREQFTSESLAGNSDILLYRQYDESIAIRHSIINGVNLENSTTVGPTSDLIKSYLCYDGKVWQHSDLAGSDNFAVDQMVQTRDPRFEATFHYKATDKSRASYLYVTKFLPRDAQIRAASGQDVGLTNKGAASTTDAPVLRYAEVLLNWIEAKAELESMGMGEVTQADIDKSINKLRRRPVASLAVGVANTQGGIMDMKLGSLPSDPDRDITVPELIWEIRRERRVEMTFEYSRFEDLKRWKKLEYMDTHTNPDLLSGAWVNFPVEFPSKINADLSVVKLNGQIEVFDSSNAANMVGFYRYRGVVHRIPFLGLGNVNPYLSPVGINQMNDYSTRGYALNQTEGWPQN